MGLLVLKEKREEKRGAGERRGEQGREGKGAEGRGGSGGEEKREGKRERKRKRGEKRRGKGEGGQSLRVFISTHTSQRGAEAHTGRKRPVLTEVRGWESGARCWALRPLPYLWALCSWATFCVSSSRTASSRAKS